jgi:hypothetical protein
MKRVCSQALKNTLKKHFKEVANKYRTLPEKESAASFCRQVAAWVPDMFGNFNSVKNHKIANNSSTT